MRLRNEALNKGTQLLVSTSTHVENGSKIAKGQDSLVGAVSQFSSLMSVMQDDFAMMNDMEREYSSEKSEVEYVLPEVLGDIAEETKPKTVIEEVETSFVPEDMGSLVDDFEDVYTSVLDTSILIQPFEEEIFDGDAEVVTFETVLALEDMVDAVLEEPVAVFAPLPVIEQPTTVEPKITTSNISSTVVLADTPDIIPQVIADEIVQMVQATKITSTIMEDKDRFTLSDRIDLPDYMREQVRLLDDSLSEDVPMEVFEPIAEDVRLRNDFQQAQFDVLDQSIQQVAVNAPEMDSQTIVQNITAVSTQAVANTTSVQATPQGEGISVQQNKHEDIEKRLKMPQMNLTRKHFEELLEESQAKGTEKMGFHGKLLQRLEVVILDPAGRMDVEIAQEITGVHVKAFVPTEMLPNLAGLESDLQVALDGQGIDLEQFELFERQEDDNNSSSNEGFGHNFQGEDISEAETLLQGGMLVSQRV